MPTETLQIHLNLAAMSGTFMRALQRQLDIVKLLEVGATFVTPEQMAQQQDFASFTPANGAQLDHEQARTAAKDWLLRGFLRDSIEATGLFLDECLHACLILQLAAKGPIAMASDLNKVFNHAPSRNHKLHLPEKLVKLSADFGVQCDINSHIQTLNKARTCVVHRLGTVTELDTNDDKKLTLKFRTYDLIVKEIESGKEFPISGPGHIVEAESVLSMKVVDKTKTFVIGDVIRLEASELYATIVTLWQFGMQMAKSVESYGQSLGLKIGAPEIGA